MKIDASCKEKIEFLKTCDPFKVRGGSGRGGKFWGAVEVEETTPKPDESQREVHA
jgi:hypothetical protein